MNTSWKLGGTLRLTLSMSSNPSGGFFVLVVRILGIGGPRELRARAYELGGKQSSQREMAVAEERV